MINVGDFLIRTCDSNPNFTKGKVYKVEDADANKVYLRGDRGVLNSIYFTVLFRNFKKVEEGEVKVDKIQVGDKLIRVYESNGFFTEGNEYVVREVNGLEVIIVGDNGELSEYDLLGLEQYFKKKVEVKEMKKVKEFTILEVMSVDKFVWDRAFNNDNNWYEVKLKVRTVNGNEKVVDKLFTCCEWDRIKRMGAFYGV